MIFADVQCAYRTISSLATILVNRLVLNLREQAVIQLPTTVETAGKFRAALPLRQPLLTLNDAVTFVPPLPTNQTLADSDSDT